MKSTKEDQIETFYHEQTIQPFDDQDRPASPPVENTLPPDFPVRRSTRSTAPSPRYGFISQSDLPDENDNPTYEVSLNGPDRQLWQKSIDDKFEAFTQHNFGKGISDP